MSDATDEASGVPSPTWLMNHALGLELQIVEAVERCERARVQGRAQEQVGCEREIARLQAELADTAERGAVGV